MDAVLPVTLLLFTFMGFRLSAPLHKNAFAVIPTLSSPSYVTLIGQLPTDVKVHFFDAMPESELPSYTARIRYADCMPPFVPACPTIALRLYIHQIPPMQMLLYSAITRQI